MSRVPAERKEAILKKLLPPYSMSVSELSNEVGISTATLYHWRQRLRRSGAAVPNSNTSSEQWSAQTKLAIVAETYSMTENELSQYCREKGLFPEQVQRWRSECMQGFMSSKEREAQAKKQAKADKLEICMKSKNLRRSCATKKRHWLKQLPCWFFEKRSEPFTGKIQRTINLTDEPTVLSEDNKVCHFSSAC
ncbi:transposase [Vibrio cholerae]